MWNFKPLQTVDKGDLHHGDKSVSLGHKTSQSWAVSTYVSKEKENNFCSLGKSESKFHYDDRDKLSNSRTDRKKLP